jgi:nitroreductase
MRKFIKSILPESIIAQISHIKFKFKMLWLEAFAASSVMSSVYYLFFSREFRREHQSVLKGRISYEKMHRAYDRESSALLRRNVHRLEKGLIMQPRRESFADGYIYQTIVAFESMSKQAAFCDDEKKWASDVLSQYFSIVSDTPDIKKARDRFINLDVESDFAYTPYTDGDRTRTTCSIEQLENLFKQRRSTRWFQEKPVNGEDLDKAIQLASLAPSACNRQPFNFWVANEPSTAVEIAKMAVGTGGFAQNIPCLVVIIGDLAAYPFEKDRHLIYIDASLAAMQLMLSLETLGLSSCPLNWPDVDKNENQISERLSLQKHQRVVMLVAIGYADPAGLIPYSQKKTSDHLRVDIN